jgi:hypothetical protein
MLVMMTQINKEQIYSHKKHTRSQTAKLLFFVYSILSSSSYLIQQPHSMACTNTTMCTPVLFLHGQLNHLKQNIKGNIKFPHGYKEFHCTQYYKCKIS